jgi:hypothetical protein
MSLATLTTQVNAAATLADVRVACGDILVESYLGTLSSADLATLQGLIDTKTTAINAGLPPPVQESMEVEHAAMVIEHEAQVVKRKAREHS